MANNRICQNCGKVITSNSRGAKWCSSSCRTVAYRKRKNIAAPDFLTKPKKTFLNPDEERELRRLNMEAEAYEAVIEPIEKEYQKWFLAQTYLQANYKPDMRGNELLNLLGKLAKHLGINNTSKQKHLFFSGGRNAIDVNATRKYITEQTEQRRAAVKEQEVELLQRQRAAMKLLDRAKARDIGTSRQQSKGGVTGADLLKMKFDTLNLEGEWKELLGEPAPNFYLAIWGAPKAGKTYLTLRMAQYLTKFGNVAYVAAEEGISKTFQKAVQDTNASDIQIIDTKDFSQVVSGTAGSDFVVIDSASKIDIGPEDITFLRETYPDLFVIVLLQSTKGGEDFKGAQQWKHDTDAMIHVTRTGDTSTATCEGRGGGGSISWEHELGRKGVSA